jgi:hypothetical protein
VGVDGLEIRHASRDDSGSVSSATELDVFFDHTLQIFCNCVKLVVDVSIIGGGLPVLPGTASSIEVASVPEVSVSVSAVLRGATFWSALSLSLKFRRFRWWRAASASVIPETILLRYLLPCGFW